MSNLSTSPARFVKNGCLIVAVLILFGATTGAAIGPESSRFEVTVYSFGCALAVIVVLRIIVKLFVYLLQAAAVLAVFGLLYVLVRMAINALA